VGRLSPAGLFACFGGRRQRCLSQRPAVILAFAALLSGCAARAGGPSVAPPVTAVDPAQQLQAELNAIFGAATVDHTQWGATFFSVRQNRTIYSLNGSRFLVPASNQKILITAAAAERLGWDFRFTTRLLGTAPISPDGTLDGDLIVTGNGDPTINTRDAERWRVFDTWAARLKAKGLKSITGRLVGDDNAFAEPGWGVGWAWDNLQYGYGAPPTALQFNENQVELLIGPGMSEGAHAIIALTPAGSGLVIRNRVSTAPPGTATSIDIDRVPGTPSLTVRGQIAVDATPTSTFASVHDPTRFYLNALRSALERYGITIGLGVIDGDELPNPVATDGNATELLVDRSPPLVEIIDIALKWSRNIYAETMLLTMAEPGVPATGARGLRSVATTLQAWGVAPESYLPRDGSGLSRYDYVSADTLAQVLRHLLTDTRHNAPFQSCLPVAGVSGTIAGRMKGTPAEGRVRAKSGTLSNVRALSGYLMTLDGDTVVFSMLANNFRVSAAEIDDMMDRAINLVVAFDAATATRSDQK
jgi:serine-type D-Ala-D-Ala carboxypeptidase/endopeptidase (penicillin-binding protein 4)